MDLKSIHYFISVFEERSFTKAADKMHVVQSAISMQIRNLEEELKTLLFERGMRGLAPTVAGRRLYERCVPIVKAIAGAKQEVLEMVQGNMVSGTVRIGLTSSMCQNTLGLVVAGYTRKYPDVHLSVTESYARNITDLVQSGALDLGLGALPLDNNSLSCRLAFTDYFVLVSGAPINGPTGTPCDLTQMKDLNLVVPSERHLLGTHMRQMIAGGRLRPHRMMVVDGMVATLESVKHSEWGALCLMNSVADRLGSGDTYIYPVVNPTIPFDLYLVHDLRRPPTAAARLFVEMFEQQLKDVAARWSKTIKF
jgi:DNA-binding transcriptional LysR family regulator